MSNTTPKVRDELKEHFSLDGPVIIRRGVIIELHVSDVQNLIDEYLETVDKLKFKVARLKEEVKDLRTEKQNLQERLRKVDWHKDVFEEPRDLKVRRTRETNNLTESES